MSKRLLFESFKLPKVGKDQITLANRVVMAPMTRSRAIDNLPNDMIKTYYAQRATAGLIITEGTAPSKNGLGYARIPGCYTTQQVEGWRKVTDAVHSKGGKIFLQIMHCGRSSHHLNMPNGAVILAPSAVPIKGQMYTDQKQMQDFPVPKAMTSEDITTAIAEYADSAALAVESGGFDGVEIHGANGYLIDQFLNPSSNLRTDGYGGSAQGRIRFAIEVADAISKKIGNHRTGIRLSPFGAFNGMDGEYPGSKELFADLATEFSNLKLAYMHLMLGPPSASIDQVKSSVRKNFSGALILCGDYNVDKAEKALVNGECDLVAFGRPYLANPTLVEKMKTNAPLTEMNYALNFTPGAEGFTNFV